MDRRLVRIAIVLSCVLVALGAASIAAATGARRAADVDMATIDVAALDRRGGVQSRSIELPWRADLLGARWTGAADAVELRVAGRDGAWSRWVELHATGDGPDPQGREARDARQRTGLGRGGRRASAPLWVGDAERVQVRIHDGVAALDLQVVAINATGSATRAERAATALASKATWLLGDTARAVPQPGSIQPRAAWGAAKPRATPALAERTLGVVVHHTAGTNRYSCAQVPALLRGIQRYHMSSQGWNDIGYNFLVDRCGGVWEGRAGGTTSAVIGAHAAGFNTGTSGIALIGTHTTARPSAAARASLLRLIAWRMDVAHVRPDGRMQLTAQTSDKYPTGSTVSVRAVSGHRDLFSTSCPGAMTYRDLTALARQAWAVGGVKVANVTTATRLHAPDDPLDASLAQVSVRAVSSHADAPLAFRLERISTGEVLHAEEVPGPVATTRFNVPATAQVAAWDVRVIVDAQRPSGQRARRSTTLLQQAAPDPQLVVTTPPQATVTPNGDGIDDVVRLAYTLGLDYRLEATLHDPATGERVATLLAADYVGPSTEPVVLELPVPSDLAAGSYELRVALPADSAAGRSVHRFPVAVAR
jgi:hypothetical protein